MDAALVFRGSRVCRVRLGPLTDPLAALKRLSSRVNTFTALFTDQGSHTIEIDAEFREALDEQRKTLPYWQQASAQDMYDGIPIVTVR